MDTIKGLCEVIESEFGEAIVARDESLAALLDVRGLGPPDLIWLQKNSKNASLLGTPGRIACFAHVSDLLLIAPWPRTQQEKQRATTIMP